MLKFLFKSALIIFALTATAQAAQTVRLPDYLCGGTDSIFADGYETGGVYASDASLGSGGTWPGNHSRSFSLGTFGQQTYYLHVPPQYQPAQAMPLMVVLEGYTGSHSASVQEAQGLRDDWVAAADSSGFMIAVPVNNRTDGNWIPADGSGQTSDYDVIAAVLADMAQSYNIERNRISAWGYSAGGNVAWDMLLNDGLFVRPTPLSAATLASLSTSAANSSFACGLGPTPCATRFANLPRKLPIDIHIGTSDPNYAWAAADHQRLLSNGWIDGVTVSYNAFVGGHTFSTAHLPQIAKFACGFALQP